MRDHDGANTAIKIAAVVAQVGGILLLLLGVAVVRSWFERAADASVEARRGLSRWWGLRSEQLRRWYAHRRGRPFVLSGAAHVTTGATTSVEGAVVHQRVARATISERDWLAYLDDRVASLIDSRDRAEQSRAEDRQAWEGQLAAQRDELRGELLRETRRGWQFILAGLLLSAVGIIVGAFA